MATQPNLISLNEVCRMTSLSRTAVNRWRSSGRFPAAVALGEKRVAFVRIEVETWIKQRIERRAVEAYRAGAWANCGPAEREEGPRLGARRG